MEPTKLFEIFEEVAHAEQRPGEMVSRYATVKIRDLVDGAIFDAAENKGLYALDGHIIVQPKYQRFYIYGELDEICTNIPELYVVSGTLNSEPSILNRPLGNQ